jgi:hypothetical protein
VVAQHDGSKRTLSITPCLWLADLIAKPWVPAETDDGLTFHVPTPSLLSGLIKSEWLESNPAGIELLVRHFRMDELEVRLLATVDAEQRQRIRDGLARILELKGTAPEALELLAKEILERKRNVSAMRALGLAVQDRVRVELEALSLRTANIDRGFDYLVSDVDIVEEDPNDLTAEFRAGSYKVEVKSVTTDEAKLTPLQAETAATEPDNFVLCVVDLRAYEGDPYNTDWSAIEVGELCRFVSGTQLPVNETLHLVQGAESKSVPARNTRALRYAIKDDIWQHGSSLRAWVEHAFG